METNTTTKRSLVHGHQGPSGNRWHIFLRGRLKRISFMEMRVGLKETVRSGEHPGWGRPGFRKPRPSPAKAKRGDNQGLSLRRGPPGRSRKSKYPRPFLVCPSSLWGRPLLAKFSGNQRRGFSPCCQQRSVSWDSEQGQVSPGLPLEGRAGRATMTFIQL